MRKSSFLLVFGLIFLGFFLRSLNYDRIPPFSETRDEFLYPWAGLSLLQTGIPTSWSNFPSYTQTSQIALWGNTYRLAAPWLEKPPLYSLMAALVSIIFGQTSFALVRLSTIRLIPLTFSLLTMLSVYLLASVVWNKQTGLIALAIFATAPIVVLGNRLGLVENFLVPLSTLAAWILLRRQKATARDIFWLTILCILTVLSKQVGVVLPFTISVILASRQQFRAAAVVLVVSALFALINPAMGYFYGWTTYSGVMNDFRQAHALGFPEMMFTLFRFPGIGHKESIFLDGTLLAGLILLFAAPFTLKERKFQEFLLFPFVYIFSLAILEGGTTWYGWHIFPLYPFAIIILAAAFHELWRTHNLLQFGLLATIIGSSSLRFVMMVYPDFITNWQLFLGAFAAIGALSFFYKPRGRRVFLITCFALYLLINIVTVLNFPHIYPMLGQPTR